jgi:alpha-glucosidase
MAATLEAGHMHLVAIADLHIANLSDPDYPPYDSATAGDCIAKKDDGSVFTGMVWPGSSLFPDFTRQQTCAWWGNAGVDRSARGLARRGVRQ